ncbi:S8 family serine peptidase, partial [Calidithermus terrae]|uniref:S8 family serine peptidase n=1 Tax=Calidithermus terrae TaxID=1408545 RepID=UPI003B84679E
MRQVLLIVLLSLLAACGVQNRPPADGSSPALAIPQERQLVVGYKDRANLEAIARRVGARVVAAIPQLEAALLELPEGLSQAQAARRLVALARYAEANRFDRQPIPLPTPKPTAQ